MNSYFYKGWDNNNQPRPRRESESEYFKRIAREAHRERRARRGLFRGGPQRTPEARAPRPHEDQPERRSG